MTLRPELLRVQLALVLLVPAVLPLAARADVHLIQINEYYTQCDNGSGEVQYIELRPLSAGQFFRQCASIEYRRSVPGPILFFAKPVFVGHGNAEAFPQQERFLIATSSFQGIVGFAPDLVMPDGTMDPQGGVIRFAADSGCSINWGTIHDVRYGDQGTSLAPGPNVAANLVSGSSFVAGTPTPRNFAGKTSSSWTCIDLSCYELSLSHTGSGSDPVASPGSSSGCSFGQYHAGENISLTASASSDWEVGSWSGTSNNSSTSTSNSLVMPASSHSVAVNYILCDGIPNDLLLTDDTLSMPALYEACNSITLGPNLFITAGGTGVIVRAPLITFVGQVGVLTGGVASFGGR